MTTPKRKRYSRNPTIRCMAIFSRWTVEKCRWKFLWDGRMTANYPGKEAGIFFDNFPSLCNLQRTWVVNSSRGKLVYSFGHPGGLYIHTPQGITHRAGIS